MEIIEDTTYHQLGWDGMVGKISGDTVVRLMSITLLCVQCKQRIASNKRRGEREIELYNLNASTLHLDLLLLHLT